QPKEKYSFLKKTVGKEAKIELEKRLIEFRARYPKANWNQINEYERQAHYMRRMLGNVANIVGKWTTFHQAFSSEKVAQAMFKYHYTVRSDDVYRDLLKRLDPSLLEIAWARTGIPYSKLNGISDELSKNHHRYGEWLREDSLDLIEKRLFDGTLEKLGI